MIYSNDLVFRLQTIFVNFCGKGKNIPVLQGMQPHMWYVLHLKINEFYISQERVGIPVLSLLVNLMTPFCYLCAPLVHGGMMKRWPRDALAEPITSFSGLPFYWSSYSDTGHILFNEIV